MAKKSTKPSIPKGYEAGEKSYKLVTEQHFYPPFSKAEAPARARKPPKPQPMPVKVVNVVKTRKGQ